MNGIDIDVEDNNDDDDNDDDDDDDDDDNVENSNNNHDNDDDNHDDDDDDNVNAGVATQDSRAFDTKVIFNGASSTFFVSLIVPGVRLFEILIERIKVRGGLQSWHWTWSSRVQFLLPPNFFFRRTCHSKIISVSAHSEKERRIKNGHRSKLFLVKQT